MGSEKLPLQLIDPDAGITKVALLLVFEADRELVPLLNVTEQLKLVLYVEGGGPEAATVTVTTEPATPVIDPAPLRCVALKK